MSGVMLIVFARADVLKTYGSQADRPNTLLQRAFSNQMQWVLRFPNWIHTQNLSIQKKQTWIRRRLLRRDSNVESSRKTGHEHSGTAPSNIISVEMASGIWAVGWNIPHILSSGYSTWSVEDRFLRWSSGENSFFA